MRGTRRWSAGASDGENVFKDEVTQEELVKRDSPGAACRACGGLVGAKAHSRQRLLLAMELIVFAAPVY